MIYVTIADNESIIYTESFEDHYESTDPVNGVIGKYFVSESEGALTRSRGLHYALTGQQQIYLSSEPYVMPIDAVE